MNLRECNDPTILRKLALDLWNHLYDLHERANFGWEPTKANFDALRADAKRGLDLLVQGEQSTLLLPQFTVFNGIDPYDLKGKVLTRKDTSCAKMLVADVRPPDFGRPPALYISSRSDEPFWVVPFHAIFALDARLASIRHGLESMFQRINL